MKLKNLPVKQYPRPQYIYTYLHNWMEQQGMCVIDMHKMTGPLDPLLLIRFALSDHLREEMK